MHKYRPCQLQGHTHNTGCMQPVVLIATASMQCATGCCMCTTRYWRPPGSGAAQCMWALAIYIAMFSEGWQAVLRAAEVEVRPQAVPSCVSGPAALESQVLPAPAPAPRELPAPWQPNGKVKCPLQNQIIRLLSYAPVFKHGNGEFHDWHMVKGMLSSDLQAQLPSDMEQFFNRLQCQYTDFQYKMDGNEASKVAFTKVPSTLPRSRNYVTERVMQFCRAHKVRRVSIKDMILYADPDGVYDHKPEHFIELISKDPDRCVLVPSADPWQVEIIVRDHVELALAGSRKHQAGYLEAHASTRKRARASWPSEVQQSGSFGCVLSADRKRIQLPAEQFDSPAGSMSSSANFEQMPVPKLVKSVCTMT